MTRPLAAEDFETIRKRQREIAAENGLAATGEICTCPPGPLVIPSCPVHNVEFRRALEASASACDCPADHDAPGVYRKVHVPGCLAHVWNPEEISAYRRWVAAASGSDHYVSLGDIRIYDRALSADEVRLMYLVASAQVAERE